MESPWDTSSPEMQGKIFFWKKLQRQENKWKKLWMSCSFSLIKKLCKDSNVWMMSYKRCYRKWKAAYPSERALVPTKIKTPLFLQRGLVEVRELWFLGYYNLRMLVGLVVQFKSVAGACEILLGLLFDFVLGFDPVKQLSSFFFIFGVSGFVTLERFVMSFFPSKGAFEESPERKRAR